MRIFSKSLPAISLAACVGLALSGSALARPDHPEVEPNDTKAQANPATMVCGDTLSGTTTGTSTTVAGAASADNFLLTTPTAAPGIYLYTLTLSSSTAGHTGTLRGLNQATGIPGTTDSTVQTSQTVGTDRIDRFYGFGTGGQMYYRVTGTTTTTAPYSVAFTCTPVTPIPVSGSPVTGSITVRPTAATDTAIDTDLWVYDSAFNAILDAGHDDGDAVGITRTLTPGTYYVALGNYNTCNNLGSPADDTWRTGLVLDFPNVLANSTTGALATMSIEVMDGNGNVYTAAGSRADSFQVAWFSFVVGGVPGPSVGGCSASVSPVTAGGTTVLSASVTPGGSPTITGVTANLSAFGLGTVPMVNQGGGVYSYSLNVPANQGAGTYTVQVLATDANNNNGACQISLSVPVSNDDCATATVVSLGTTTASNVGALSGNDEQVPSCAGGNNNTAVWFRFTPAANNTYTIATCGANFDTVLTAFSGACGSLSELACDDDTCDGVTPPGSGLASQISTLSLNAGETYYIRVASYGAATGPFPVTISIPTTGACCNNTTGACTTVINAACGTAATYQGDNSTCSPSPCPPAGACCTATGGCSVVVSAACTGNYAGDNTVCDASICALGACCTAGSCAVMNPVACTAGGGTYQGAGASCGGPSYTLATGQTGFEDISTTGTIAATVSACDDCGETLPIGFTFNYLGTDYTDVWVCSNGFVQFGGGNSNALGNVAIPNAGVPNNFIAALWDDLNPGAAGDVYYQLSGAPGSQQLIVSWQNVPQFNNTDNNSFQIVLHEGTSRIELRYGAISNEATAGDYTIGFEDASGLSGGSVPGVDLGAGLVTYDGTRIVVPNPCNVVSTGACCSGSSCSATTSAACTGANTSFSGNGTACNAAGNYTTPCCKADYNHVGGVTVQDIFDFLNGYFTVNLQADANGNGAVTVQDIFDFLGAYFAGCA
jgi:hypothetical protein